MADSDRQLGDIATVVLLENDKVKIWNLIVDPGEASPWHLHERDYVTIVVEGEALVAQFEDGTRERRTYEPGDVNFTGEHRVHRVVNDTETRYKNVLIEFKG